jgi:hypothetical protein
LRRNLKLGSSIGAEGFEPPNGGTKNRCLTTWRRPSDSWDVDSLAERTPMLSFLVIFPQRLSGQQEGLVS